MECEMKTTALKQSTDDNARLEIKRSNADQAAERPDFFRDEQADSSSGSKHPFAENSLHISTAKLSLLPRNERKRHSEPIQTEPTEGRNRFDRRRLWTATKQESFDLPEEFKCQTEDNVFPDDLSGDSGQGRLGRPIFSRSQSVPATLPDVVPEPKSDPGNPSPDVLFVGEKEAQESHPPVKSILNRRPSSAVGGEEEAMEEFEKKANFEGPVCYEFMEPPPEIKRKKSVTFQEAGMMVMMSEKGKKAQSHFRGPSSGYGSGSQSDGSQLSQTSNVSSEKGSVLSDDVLIDESSDETDDDETSDTQHTLPPSPAQRSLSRSCAAVDGGSDEEEVKPCEKSEHPSQTVDDVELWRREMSPKFHTNSPQDGEGLPILSIFESESVCLSDIGGGEFSPQRRNVCEGLEEAGEEEEEGAGTEVILPIPSTDPLLPVLATVSGSAPPGTELHQHENRTSPTTKEECQREFFLRIFEDKMLKYDPAKESLSDLLDWFKNNCGDALTPSPKSPFYSLSASPQNPYKMQEAINTTTTHLMALAGLHPACPASAPHLGQQQPTLLAHPHANFNQLPRQPHFQNIPRHPGFPNNPISNQNNSQKPMAPHPESLQNRIGGQTADQGMLPDRARYGLDERFGVSDLDRGESRIGLPATVEEPSNHDFGSSLQLSPSSSSSMVRDSHLELLVNLSQCTYALCTTDTTCTQNKSSFADLKKAMKRGPQDLGSRELQLLNLLHVHNTNCDLPHCGVSWCRYLSLHNQDGRRTTQEELQILLSNPLHSLIPKDVKFDRYAKLDPSLDVSDDEMPQETRDWIVMCPLSQSFTVARVIVPDIRLWPRRQWVVKVTSAHEEGDQVGMLRKLRGLRHPNVVHHNWVACSSARDLLVVCTDYIPGFSLRELLDQEGPLSFFKARYYLLQVLSAVQQLHGLGIAYLNWTCCNMLLSPSCDVLKLTNLTLCVDVDRGCADIGTLKLTLPPDVVLPELLVNGGYVTYNSDSWGIACVFYEMLKGIRPWYHLRHLRQQDIWNKILQQVPPDLPQDLPECAKLLMQTCLRRSPEHRQSVDSIMKKI